MRDAAADPGRWPERVLTPSVAERVALALEIERAHWVLWAPVSFGFGIALYFSLPREPEFWPVLALAAAAVVLRGVWRQSTVAAVITGVLLAMALGLLAAKVRADRVAAPVLTRYLNGVEVKGIVERVEPRATRGQRLTLRVTSLGDLDAAERPAWVRVRALSALAGVNPGDALRMKATLGPPAKPALPGGFDFARAAYFQGLGGIGYAIQKPELDAREIVEPTIRSAAAAWLEGVRQSIGTRVTAALPGENGAIATALITGERGGITDATNDAYRDSGLLHILSISGLHMVVMAGALFYAVRLLLAAVPGIALRYPIKKWAAIAGLAGTFAYLALSGASFATVRSAIMIAILFFAILLDRPALALRNVAIAALLILAIYPESLLDAGFQMSFAAVVSLVASYEYVRRRMGRQEGGRGPVLNFLLFFGGIVLSTVVASLAVAPFAAFHFHKSQQFAVLANLVAIPICNLVVMPAALLTLVLMPFGLETLPLRVMGHGIDAVTRCANWVARLPGAVGAIPAIPPLAFHLMVLGGLWLTLWQAHWRRLGLVIAAIGIALTPFITRPDLLIGRDGRLVALRGTDGHLSALPARSAKFELSRWLESDGDARSAKDVSVGKGFRCDAAGCTAAVKGLTLAVALRPAALEDDCEQANLLVLSIPAPKACVGSAHVFDLFGLKDGGTHAVYIGEDGTVTIDTVAAHRGERPWSPKPIRPIRAEKSDPARDRSVQPGADSRREEKSRVGQFAPPPEFSEALRAPRPEIEDDDGETAGREAEGDDASEP